MAEAVCLAAVICGARCASRDTVDELADEYVWLAFALDQHDPDFIDALVPFDSAQGRPFDSAQGRPFDSAQGRPFDSAQGRPVHLQVAASLDEIVTRAGRVREATRAAQGDRGRLTFLAAQLAAIERRARWRRGERTTIRDEAAALGLKLSPFDGERVARLRHDLDRALEGSDPLPARLARTQRDTAVPRSRLDETMRRAIDECRARSARHLRIPEGRIELRYVIETPWLAYTQVSGAGQSTIALRRDALLSEEDLLLLACHEAYPGHHLQNVVWDDQLFRQRHWVEFSLTPLFTPHAIMAERAASAATALLIPEAARSPARGILDALAPHALAVAVAHVDGEIDRDTALRRLRDELLMPRPEQFIDFVTRYRAYAAAYVAPDAPFRTWAEYESLLVSPEKLVQGAAR